MKNRPKTSFMASNVAAMPPELCRNFRRLMPSRLAGLVGELFDSRFDALLLFGLRHRHVLAVRNHPRGDGRAERLGDVGAFALGDLLFVQQPVIFLPDAPGFIPLRHR